MKDYTQSVFLNCPFDDDYKELFNAILFTVHRCGFILRCSKEYDDTSKVRIDNIIHLIDESKYSIHDISRVGLDKHNSLPRFNMPLELGIFIGALHLGQKRHKVKEYLIIESDQYRFKQFISDISGQDIKAHDNDPKKVVKCVRDWLAKRTNEIIPSASIIYEEFENFIKDLPDLCTSANWVVSELTFEEYSSLATSWLTLNINSNSVAN
jgi:hypothetical protein